MRQYASKQITKLEPNEIFVFGSNDVGNHCGGAALLAYQKFGALMSVGRGPQGQSYAISTLNLDHKRVELFDLELQIMTFLEVATKNPHKCFLVTKIGCGIAGFKEEEMIPLFYKHCAIPDNVILPEGW